jgi:Carbohydrate binding domain
MSSSLFDNRLNVGELWRFCVNFFATHFKERLKMNRVSKLMTALALTGAATVMGQNLLPNPGFENGGDSWSLWQEGSTPAVSAVTYPTTGGRNNSAYARFEVTTTASENWHVQLQVPAGWDALNGAHYELKFWAKAANASSFHFGIQDGPATNFAYRTGVDFTLTPDWTEYTLTYTSDVEGNGALRFNLFLGLTQEVYGFDDFSLTATPVSIRNASVSKAGSALQVSQGRTDLTVAVAGLSGSWKAELYDLHGAVYASATGRGGSALTLGHPGKSGTYFIRANSGTRSWVRKVSIQ